MPLPHLPASLLAALLFLPPPAAAPPPPPPGRVLACYWGLDRATDATFLGFERHILAPLGADLCAAVTDKHRDGSGAWRDVAKYLDVYQEPRSYESFVSEKALKLSNDSDLWYIREDNFLFPGGIQAMYSKQRIWRLILENGLLEQYDWFLFTRTDLLWLAPVFDFRADESKSVFVPYAGWKNDWQGYYDRAVVVPREHVKRVLTVMDVVSLESHTFLDTLKGYPGSVGQSTNCESFFRQYLEFYRLPVKRFNHTAFVTASTASFVRLRVAQLNNDTGHTYKYTDEYIAAVNNALNFYKRLELAPLSSPPAQPRLPKFSSAAELGGGDEGSANSELRFYVITIEEAERINATLTGCALSAWAMAVYERLLSHPLRTKHKALAVAVFAPPHGGWDFHWPVPNGNRANNSAREDLNLPLMPGHEPYGFELSTSCRTFYQPCGYEGCWDSLGWAWGREQLAELVSKGKVFAGGADFLRVLEQLFDRLQLSRGAQRLVFYDSGSPGPVAYGNQPGILGGSGGLGEELGGYDLPLAAYADDRFSFALASSLARFYRPGVDVSLPTPWSENIHRYVAHSAPLRTFFLTFKGNFGTSRPFGDIRNVAAKALHDPSRGVVVVDSGSEEGKSFDYEQLMFDSVFTLILRGDQPYSYRYTEAVCSGAVPVMVDSGWVPPFSGLHNFSDYGILVLPSELPGLVARLRAMSDVAVERLRRRAHDFCMRYLVTVHHQTDALIESVLRNAAGDAVVTAVKGMEAAVKRVGRGKRLRAAGRGG